MDKSKSYPQVIHRVIVNGHKGLSELSTYPQPLLLLLQLNIYIVISYNNRIVDNSNQKNKEKSVNQGFKKKENSQVEIKG